VLLGELHGTKEVSVFLGDLVCRALARGLSVSVALEWYPQEPLERYLASGGSRADRDALLAGNEWSAAIADGRGGDALVLFLERMRQFVAKGAPLSVYGFAAGDLQQRVAALAARRARAPRDLFFMLAGNCHTCAEGDCCGYRSEGMRLGQDHGWKVTSLNVATAGGTAFGVLGSKGTFPGDVIRKEPSAGFGPGPRFVRLYGKRRNGYDGAFFVGPITASLPVKADAALRQRAATIQNEVEASLAKTRAPYGGTGAEKNVTLRGQLVDLEGGGPVAGVEVVAAALTEKVVSTAPDGTFAIAGLPAMPNVELRVEGGPRGYLPFLRSIALPASGGVHDLGALRLVRGDPQARRRSLGANRGIAGLSLAAGPDGNVLVDGLVAGSPAAALDIQPGSRLETIDGRSVGGLGLDAVVFLLMREAGSTVDITVLAPGGSRPSPFTIVLARPSEPHRPMPRGISGAAALKSADSMPGVSP
jgi:hypothetical protein